MFEPIASANEYADELRASYTNQKNMPPSLSLKQPHLFRNETEAVRKVRIHACMAGFDRTRELFSYKVDQPKRDPEDIYGHGFGISQTNDEDDSVDYDDSSLVDDGLPAGWINRSVEEKALLMSQFEEYNIKFWCGIFKYHPLFYHHRCLDWKKFNNQTKISMCPMGVTNISWRQNNDLRFLDSTSLLPFPLDQVLKPLICHKKKLEVCMTCSRLENHLNEEERKCVFHGGMSAMTDYLKENCPDFVSLIAVANKPPALALYRVVYSRPKWSNLSLSFHTALNNDNYISPTKSRTTTKTGSVTTTKSTVIDENENNKTVDKTVPLDDIQVANDESNVSVMSIDTDIVVVEKPPAYEKKSPALLKGDNLGKIPVKSSKTSTKRTSSSPAVSADARRHIERKKSSQTAYSDTRRDRYRHQTNNQSRSDGYNRHVRTPYRAYSENRRREENHYQPTPRKEPSNLKVTGLESNAPNMGNGWSKIPVTNKGWGKAPSDAYNPMDTKKSAGKKRDESSAMAKKVVSEVDTKSPVTQVIDATVLAKLINQSQASFRAPNIIINTTSGQSSNFKKK